MSGFQMKPLELKDFSGGLTDNFLTAGPTHYQYADNFWITVDKHLQERYGTIVLDSVAYNLPTQVPQRVSNLFTYINESILLAQSGRSIFWYNPGVAWNAILGPQNQEALGAGDIYSSVTSAEWNRHIYFTSDAPTQPVKVFRDSTNTYQVRTAGLPRAKGTPNISQDQVLAKCIALANDLRNSMVQHINDLSLHASIDSISLGLIAPACTNLSTLLTLVNSLTKAYEGQRSDASVNGSRAYHYNITSFTSGFSLAIGPSGPYVKLSNQIPITISSTVTATQALLLAAAQVDDLAQKWYWHRLSLWVHDTNNVYVNMNKYATTQPKVGLINTGQAVCTSNLTDVFNFVNNIKFLYNKHVNSGGTGAFASHTNADGALNTQNYQVFLPDCVDYDSMALLVFHQRCLYQLHLQDVSNTFRTILFTTSATSTAVTAVNYANPYFAGVTVATSQYIYAPGIWTGGGVSNRITGSGGAGLATMAQTAIATNTQIAGQLSFSEYHVSLSSAGAQLDSYPPPIGTWAPITTSQITSQVDSVGTDALTWVALASEVYNCLSAHALDSTTHVAANGLTTVGTVPYTPFFIPTVASYGYAFIYTNTYTVEPNGLQYTVQSNPIFVGPIETSSIIPPGATVLSKNTGYYPNVTYTTVQPVAISNLPAIVNSTATNYDTANITCDVYRTTDGGTTYYKVASVANGISTYSDQTSDAVSYSNFPALSLNQTLYTTGGVVGNDQPPLANCLTLLNQFMYYGAITDTGQYFPNRIRQALPNNPDSSPATFFDDLEDAIIALSSTRSVVIALCSHSIYRLAGNFNSLGQGVITHEKISDTMGCVSANSVVRTEIGVFFAGLDGFYYTDGYQLIKITIDLNSRYQQYTQNTAQQKRIKGCYDKLNRRIYWTVQTNPTDTNPDVIYALYLDYGVKPDAVFTAAVYNPPYVRPSSVAFFGGNLVYGHEKGYVMKTAYWVKTDPIVDTTTAPANWVTAYIPYKFASTALDFGTLFKRKWNTKIHFVGNNSDTSGGNMAIQFVSVADNILSNAQNLPIVNTKQNPMWGDPNWVWQPGDLVNSRPWSYDGKVDLWRRFPAGYLRCDTRQIIAQPAFCAVYRHEDWPPFFYATTNNGAKSVVLQLPTGYSFANWPLDIVNMQFSFSSDNYVKTYTVTALSNNTATVSDPGNTLPTSTNLGWVIRGYKKEQRVHINAIIVYYDYLGDKTDQYLGPQSAGENT